jgi:hypothetical protein
MLSEAHQYANAANARLSTGPRTADGKARSSQNARTHGLTAAQLRNIRRMETELTASAQSYLDILDNPDLTAKLDRLARHQTRIERTFHRSLRELKSLQTDAALAATLPPEFIQRVQPLASKTQLAKRTQALAIADRLNGPEEEYWSGADAEVAALRSAFANYERPQTVGAGS